MDTSDPDITFDFDGTCCYCRIYDTRVHNEVFHGQEGEQRLNSLVEKMKNAGKGKQYDCLIGVSGGADSTMALWLLKKYGLRVLAVHLDNGWDSELAVDNIKMVLEKLDVDLFTYVLDWDEFRDIQLAFLRASVPNCEVPTDHAIVALHFKVAVDHRIKYVINGGNVATEAFIPNAWAYNARDLRHLRAIHRRFGKVPLKSFPQMGLLASMYMIFAKRIRWITILNYFDYNKPEAIKILQKELGWRPYGDKHYESVYTRFYQGYLLRKKFGFDKRRAHLSNLVLSGNLKRQEALDEIEKESYLDSKLCVEDREFVIKKLGLSEATFEEIIRIPPKTHYDYPTQRFIFEKMPKLFGIMKKIATRV